MEGPAGFTAHLGRAVVAPGHSLSTQSDAPENRQRLRLRQTRMHIRRAEHLLGDMAGCLLFVCKAGARMRTSKGPCEAHVRRCRGRASCKPGRVAAAPSLCQVSLETPAYPALFLFTSPCDKQPCSKGLGQELLRGKHRPRLPRHQQGRDGCGAVLCD